MDIYSARGQITAVTALPGDTALGVLASTLTRARIYQFIIAGSGTPQDFILRWLIRRFTADGTRTVVTPQPLDAGAPVAQLGAGQNYTVEPTYAATDLMDIPLHLRSTYQWMAAPGNEIIIPATAGAGLGITPWHAAYILGANATLFWEE